MRYRIPKRNLISSINVTPFVDVMLVLLVVFMISSPEIMPSLLIDLPKVEKSSVVDSNNPVILTIDSSSGIYLNDKLVGKENLIDEMVSLTKNDMNSRIFIKGDEKSNYGFIAQVISIISSNGFKKIALVTNSKSF